MKTNIFQRCFRTSWLYSLEFISWDPFNNFSVNQKTISTAYKKLKPMQIPINDPTWEMKSIVVSLSSLSLKTCRVGIAIEIDNPNVIWKGVISGQFLHIVSENVMLWVFQRPLPHVWFDWFYVGFHISASCFSLSILGPDTWLIRISVCSRSKVHWGQSFWCHISWEERWP